MGYITPADVGISDDRAAHVARGSLEPGTDYKTGYGTDLRAPEDGEVIAVDHSNDGGEGRRISFLIYSNGEVIDFIHLSAINVGVGQRVSKGQRGICLSGASGFGNDWHYGPHVHVTRRARRGLPYAQTLDFEDAVDGGGSSFPARDLYGADWVVAIQGKLLRLGYDIGGSGADSYDGEMTQAAVRDVQSKNGLDPDGVAGPLTNAVLDRLLTAPTPAPAPAGQAWPAFPLPAGQYFGPEAGGDSSISGYHSYGDALAVWQQRMKDRGWTITVDGRYGPVGASTPQGETASVALAFQTEKGLTKDSLIGRETWDAAWTTPVTPPATAPAPSPGPTAGWNATDRPDAEIQAFLQAGGFYAGEIGVAVIAFQASKFIDTDGIWGRTSDGLAFPPAGSIHGVDYSFARPDAGMLASRGIRLAGRYLWPARHASKGITRAELDALTANGIGVFFIYEEDGKELLGGREAGVRVATAAEAELTTLGLAGHPIYFNVDYDAPAADLPKILEALEGVGSVIGADRVGLYAGFGPVKAAFDAEKIRWGFQTYAWSGGQWDARAQLQQWSNGQWGDSVDFTRALVAEYGQNPVAVEPSTPDTVAVDRTWLQSIFDKLKQLLGGRS